MLICDWSSLRIKIDEKVKELRYMDIDTKPSSFLSLLQGVVHGLLLEGDIDISGGQLLEGGLDGLSSLLKEVLLVLVDHDLSHLRSVKSDSDSVADDASGQQKLFQNGFLNTCKGSAEGSLLGSVLFNPSRLDVSSSNQKHGGLQLLLEFADNLLVEGGQENLVALVGEVNESDRFLLAVGDLDDFVDFNELTISLVVGIQVSDYFLQSGSHLHLNGRVVSVLVGPGSGENG